MSLARKPFVVIDAEILNSTVWQEAAHIKLVWMTLLILCDTDGYVGASIPGIAKCAGVTLEQAEEAMDLFQRPDHHSRSKAHEGRRIVEAERGFRILNFVEHIDRMSSDRARARERLRRFRARRRAMAEGNGDETLRNAGNVSVRSGNREQGIGSKQKNEQHSSAAADARAVFDYWAKTTGTELRSARVIDATMRRISARLRDKCSVEQLKACVDASIVDEFYVSRMYYKQPEVIWRNAERVQSLAAKATQRKVQHKEPVYKDDPEMESNARAAMAWITERGGIVKVRAQVSESGKSLPDWLTEHKAPPLVAATLGPIRRK